MRTEQPDWKFIANLGDANPLEYGGYFVFEDTTGVYGCEAERVEPNLDGSYTIHRILLDRLKSHGGCLVPLEYAPSWPHPLPDYEEWFTKSLTAVAACVGTTDEELRERLCSANGTDRAQAYRDILDFHGWDNGDSSPLTLSRKEAAARYASVR